MNEDWTTKIASINANISAIKYYQQCMLCHNTRTLPEGMHYCSTPWVCDECKEAIAFIKDFKAGIKEVSAEQAKEIDASIALL
jgi:hypothetical protein